MSSDAPMYVYAFYDAEGRIVYVGKGRNHRCLDRHKRSTELAEFMDLRFEEVGLEFVKILYRNLSSSEAHTKEQGLINELQPRFNRMGVSAANAGRAQDNHNSKFAKEEVRELREKWSTWEGSMRAFHRKHRPDVGWTAMRSLLLGISYVDEF